MVRIITKTKLTNYMFSIINLKDNKIIGACGLLYINWVIRSVDFSFYIGEKNEYISNSDISMESVKLLIDYGFKNLNLNKIWMELYEFDNLKINFFTKKFDLKKDAVLRDNCFEDGKLHNSFIISLLYRDYISNV